MNVLDEKRSSPELRGYVKERIRKMQDVMARKGVDVTILMRPENVFYFSNFNPILISHVPYFILTRDDAFLLVHCIRHDHAVNEGAVDKVLCYGKWGATQAVAMDAMDAMRELLGGGPLTVGVEGDYASMNFLDRLKTKLQVKGYVDIAQDAVDLRLIKDPHEIKMCRISGELVDLGVKLYLVQKAGSWFSMGETRIGQGRDAAKRYLQENPETADKLEADIRRNFDKLMSNQSRIAAKAAGRAVDVSADDFEDAD